MFVQAAAAFDAGPGEGSVSLRISRRTHQPVRRNSRLAGKDDRHFWKHPASSAEVWKIVRAAERYDAAHKEPGKHCGPLGSIALDVLRLFARLMDRKTGRLDPSYDFMCRTLSRSRDSIHRALQRLREHGFLDWLRRYTPTEGEGKGPQVQQTSNAYRLFLPQKVAQWLGWFGRDNPPPDDATHATEARSAEMAAYVSSLTLEQKALHIVEDEGLAASLAALGRAMALKKQRESEVQGESSPD